MMCDDPKRDEFVDTLKSACDDQWGYQDFTPAMIEALSNDNDTHSWVEHCLTTMPDEYASVKDLFEDEGFRDYLHAQGNELIFNTLMKGDDE